MNKDTNIPDIEISDCKKGLKYPSEIDSGFNADDICMSCPNIIYKDGVISCKYSKVN